MNLRPRLRMGLRGPSTWWALAFTAFTLGAQWLPGVVQGWRFERGAYMAGAWWQLLTAQWVHWTSLHAAVNALGFTVLLLAFAQLVAGRVQVLALLGGYAGVALVVALDANCAQYAGASGALHGLLAGSALALLLPTPASMQPAARAPARQKALGAIVLLGLVTKLVVQHSGASQPSPGWLGFATYYPAHEAGAVGGLAAVLLVHALRRLRLAPRPGGRA